MSQPVGIEYNQKDMPFRRLGPSGLRVPLFSLGGWLTFGGTVHGDPVKDIIRTAIENGINMFDEAEEYSRGNSERELGRVLKELGIRRADYVITTKIFWGTRPGPNNGGLSRKHIIEGLKESLERLQTDCVDVVFAHRADHNVPMEEVAYYWATSEWTAREIEEAFLIAEKYGLHKPMAEQCQHHPLYKKHHYATTVFSALAGGVLTGKYNDGIPEGSRFNTNKENFKQRVEFLNSDEGKKQIAIVKELTKLAETELNCKVSHLALAWVAKNPNTSTVILGATSPEQILDNLKALEVIPKLTPEVLEKIEKIVNNKPSGPPTHGRQLLDRFGRL